MSLSVSVRLKPTLCFFLPCIFVLFLLYDAVHADAFLSQDRIYYGADSYTVDYELKIINAVGHAYYRKEAKRVDADRVVIHYEENRKVAYFYGNVVLVDSADKSRIGGSYAEARFREDYYFVEGDPVYSNEETRITSRRIESREDEGYCFIDDVRYSDGTYTIASSSLYVKEGVALFEGEAHAVHVESKDSIRCGAITYFLSSEDLLFREKVLYIEGEGGEDDDALVIQSDVMRYFRNGDMFVLIGNVYMLNSSYTLRASVVRYRRKDKLLEAVGDIVVWDGDKHVYCNNLQYDVSTDRVVFLKEVRGVFSPRTGPKGNS
jgi:lipopolysaccharide assembly outer membrane protein LptD (OstA)